MIPNFTKKLVFLSIFLACITGFSQEYNSFEVRYQNNLKGDLTFISNQIVNRDGGTATTEPEDGYNNLSTNNNNNPETGGRRNFNDFKDMQYVRIDPDPTLFSSSTSNLAFPNPDCNIIRYAGLYWSATYPSATANGSYGGTNGSFRANTIPIGQGRQNDFNQVKFRVPGGAYVDIVADEVLFDGFTSTDPSVQINSPYACYADVTALVTSLANPTGDYTVANIRATTGGLTPGGGSAGGWTLVIVYENPTLTGKLITTFDGFARVRNTDRVDIPYNGFTTIPVGQVNADIGAATLEGDFRITGDRMRIRAASNAGFTTMSNGSNPANNFFNSNITLNGVGLPGRNPSSANTLGFDTDIFTLNNFANSIIPNDETAATFQFQTNGDQYYPYFNSFNIEVIEPDIVLEKRVEDIAGNDITGMGVNLGQTLDYVLSFRNLGNDDGTNYTIRDVLPVNVTLDESNFVLPPGVTYTFDASAGTVLFSIPDNLIQVNDPVSSIRMRVNVAENCFDFVDACTDLIQNTAFSTFQGVVNDNQITDDPSITDFNDCGFIVPGATNFLLDDLENCNFTRTVQLCGDNILLDAGDNFDTYVWVFDDNGNGLFDATDTVLSNGTSDTLLVDQEGTYIVDKIVADPCKGFKEIFVVERFGTNTVNPIVDYFNTVNADADVTNDIEGEVVTCSIDGDLLAKLFLCGAGDSQILQSNITDAQTISWELLDESSCTAAPDDCANKNATCTWNQVASGSTYTVNSRGQYRLVVTYQNGCFNRFYFDVFQNNLNIEYNTRDIICTTDGNINITNLGSGYGFQLIDITNNAILVPYSANNGPDFTITSNGQYRVDVVQLDGSGNPIPNACIFSTPDIGIRDRAFQVDITTTPANCNAQGSIQLDILNVEPNYTYVLRRSDGTLIDDETAQPDNTFTFNVNEGDYIVEASTGDGCTFTQAVVVARTPDPTVSALLTQNIGCSAGTIGVTALGGFPNPDYGFAIWSKDGTNLYPNVSSIPGSAYQVEDVFTFGWRDTDNDSIDEYFPGEDGTYVFVVVDANGCFAFSNEVTIIDNGPLVMVPTNTPIACQGSNSATLTIGLSGGLGTYNYSIDDGLTFQTTNTFPNLGAGTYQLRVTDDSGCDLRQEYIISEPAFALSASAGVTEVIECNPALGSEVRILNATGGTAPYEYSFDGGANYNSGPGSNIAFLPAGTHNLTIRDAGGCIFLMTVVVPDPVVPPTFTPVVDYECDGEATVTVNPSNTTNFDYTYELNSVLNTPEDSNIFGNVPVGTQIVTVNYIANSIPVPGDLFLEDFGAGAPTSIPEIDPAYCYEPQDGSPSCPGFGTNPFIQDGEYSVSSSADFANLFGSWRRPNEQSGNPNGRYLIINVGGVAGVNGIVYAKRNVEVLSNRDITISLEAFNLLEIGAGGADPSIEIQLVNSGGAVIASTSTGNIPKNMSQDDWQNYTVNLNPGTETNLDIVIRTNSAVTAGNDIVIDDIRAFQTPLICASSIDIPVIVESGRAFDASIINSTDVSCNGLADGTITFEVENFDPVAGFDYSTDGGTNYINSTSSPVTTAAVFGVGNQTILVRRADDNSCNTDISQNISEPTVLVADASITTPISCVNGGATITASATGGIPNYEYQLEDNGGGIITPYQTPTTFTGIAPGDYIVRVRDNNLCEDPIDVVLTVSPTNTIVFNLTPTACYSGANDAAIQVNVTDGNGDYTFSINGGSFVAPAPTTATSYTFNNLASGTYAINVSDGSGCVGTTQNITIDPQLTVTASAPRISACAISSDITITAAGGDANYVYAVVTNGTAVVDGDFNTTNPVTGFASGVYDVYVRDNGGNTGYCTALYTLTIDQDAPILITPTPTAVSCFNGADGAISIVVDSGGEGPFQYSIDGGTTYQILNNFPNLTTGTYPVQVRDTNNCETTSVNVVVAEPAQLIAEAAQTQDYTCLQLGQITVGNVTPTTGGSGNYQYSINGGLWTSSTTGGHTFTDLMDGTYSIRVRDANAIFCETTIPDVIIAPLPTEPVFTTAIAYNCDGSGTVTVTPFDASYIYILDGVLPGQTGANGNIITNVAVGTHTITVNYGSDCTVDTIVIVEPGNTFEASITAFENLDCNTDTSGTITITADNFGAGGYQYSLDGTTFVGPFTSAEQITGLVAQAYTITVRDVNDPIAGCTVVLNQILTEPAAIVASASITEEFNCNNTGATITASAIGGTPTYQYQLEDNLGSVLTGYQSVPTFTNIAPGNYIVRVQDSNSCSDPIDTAITIVAPTNPTFTATQTTCYSGANDASIQVDVTSIPGNGGFQFNIDGGPWITPTPATATTYTFMNLSNGSYDIAVRDAFGCAAPTQTIVINPQLTATFILNSDLTCLVDASVTINATGGSGSYSYEWSNTAVGPWNTSGITTNVFTSNTAGTYFFRVTDTTAPTACEVVTNSVVITPAVLPEITSVTPTDLRCNADNSGALDVVINTALGLAPYEIDVQNTTTATNFGTQTSGLPAGDYIVTITDAKGCTDTEPATINQPDPINYSVTSVPITCDIVGMDINPGSITITGTTGGTAEYTYLLTANNGIPTQTYTTTAIARDHTFNILTFGIYQIDVVDANGCSAFSTEIIASPPNDLDIDVTTLTSDCTTGGTAIVTVGASVGSGNYEFAILETFTPPYSSTFVAPDPLPVGNTDTATFTNLIPGVTYTFVVHDLTTNCFYFETADAPINTPSNLTATLDEVANVSCTGSADGNISFTFDNYDSGATSVEYEIFNSQSNLTTGNTGSTNVNPPTGAITIVDFATLPPGEYFLLLSETGGIFNGCTVFGGEFTIRESVNLLDVNLAITKNDNCNTDAGTITATGLFGTAPYEYQFLPAGSTAPTVITWAGSSSNVFDGEGGSYDVYIRDANDCIQMDTILLPTDLSPEISLTIVDECVAEGQYEVLVTLDQAGILPYALSVNGSAFQNVTFNGSNQYTVTGLSTGATQTIAIQDLNGCGETETFTIQPILQFNATLTTLLDCEAAPANNAEITIDVIAGSGSYDYEITGPVNEVRTNLPSDPFVWNLASLPGTYRVTLYDTNTAIPNCSSFIDVVVPDTIAPVLVVDAFTDVSCNAANDGSISVSVPDNGIGPYTFEVISGPGSTATFPIAATTSTSTSAIFNNLEGTTASGITYTIRATAVNGCTDDITQVIVQPEVINIPVAAINVIEFGCAIGNNTNNASITIDNSIISGGSGTYVRYEFINDQGTVAPGDDIVLQNGSSLSYTETNTAGGSYIINAYDDRGCIGSTTAAIAPFDELLPATLTVDTEITCTNSGDDITINAFGSLTDSSTPAGLANYEFRQLPAGVFQTSNQFLNLPVGSHSFEVRNINTSCVVSITHEVEDPNTFEISTTTTDAICFGDDGSVSFTINDPVNPYTGGFTWQIYNSQGTATIADDAVVVGANGVSANTGPSTPFAIPAGQYRVEITQDSDPNCINNALFTIAGPSVAITANTNLTPITCVGNDGIIEIIDVLGGWGGYSYYVGTVPPTVVGDYVATLRFENLASGTYQAWVIDQNGCQQEVQNTIVLADPTPIAATLQINQSNCTNFSGEIEVVGVTGGQGSNYTYQLIKNGSPIGTAQSTTIFLGLDAGSYQVQVTDQLTCTFTTLAELLYEPIVPLATVVKTIDCSVDPGGHITITQTGGSGNFNYDVTFPDLTTGPSNTTGVFTGLTQIGDYVFTITDQNAGHACSTTVTQNLQDRVLPILTIDTFADVTCNGANDGTISVSVVDNGVGPYTFEIISGSGSTATFPIVATSSTSTTATFTGLEGLASPGITYTIRATGANGCTSDETQVILLPDAITNVSATVVEYGCVTGNNTDFATITIDDTAITGGSGTYVRYEFINTSTTTTVQDGTSAVFTETDFAGGNYTINVYDDNGCLGNTTAVILPFAQISDPVVTTTVDVSCNPGNDAEIQLGVTITPATAIPNLEYVVTGTDIVYTQTNATGLFTGLGVGNYIVSITNLDTNCMVTTTHQIIDPNIIEVVATKLTDEECLNNGVDDGSFEVAINNYTGNYSYQVFDISNNPVPGFTGTGNTGTALIISNLPGGGYYVRITETELPFCEEDSNAITIIAPSAPITIVRSEEQNPSCTNDQGVILVAPEGGVGPYTIELVNTTTSQTYTENNVQAFQFTDLSAGDFNITITDAVSCVETETITLLRPDDFVPTISTTPLSCFNGNTATVFTTVPVGRNVSSTATYQYQLNRYDDLVGTTLLLTSGVQTSITFPGINAGFYSITTTDNFGCSFTSPIEEIVNPTEVIAQLIRTSPLTCATGIELELSATGGSGTYEYSIDGLTWIPMSGSTASIPNASITGPLVAGTYRYFVRDAVNGCPSVLSNEISEDPILPLAFIGVDASIIACVGDTATITASATGGLGNYMYELYTDASLNVASRVAGPQVSGIFNNLISGTYYVNVLSEDCTTPAERVDIAEPTPLDYTDQVINVLCFGDSNGSITVTLSGGVGGYQYAISPNLNQFDTENTFEDLAPGDYTVIAQDENGCFIQLDYTITAPEPLTATGVATPEVCAGDEDGTITLTIEGGTAPYSTRFSDESDFVQDRTAFTDLSAGGYIIFIRDANGCTSDVGITVEPGTNLNATVEPVYECTTDTPDNFVNITLEDPAVIGDVLYAIDSTDPADLQLNPDFRNIAPGSHYIAIAHANGCIRTIDFEIEDFEPLALTVAQTGINQIEATATGGQENYTFYFGDDNNGIDNTYIINRTDTYVVRVVDENGCEATANLFIEFIDIEIPNFFTPDGDGLNDVWMPRNQEGFPEILTIIFDRYGREVYRMNLNSPGWDGLYNDTELPTGDYWYIIKLRGENDDREFVGHFTLYR